MTAGNRLFLGTGSGLKASTSPGPLTDTGWSWGVSFFDADNDGDPEFAVANGHETAPNVKDYERQFWLHDLYLAGSTNDTAADLYFRSVQARRAADRASYGGWQANTFFLNLGKRGFEETAFLLGLGFDQDSQNLLSEDVDGDGRIDLILTTYEKASGRPQSLRILRNRLQAVGNWIGLRLDAAKRLTAGVVVRVESPEGTLARWIVNGDSYRSQHSGSVHFGLGRGGTPTRMTIEWPARKTNSIPLPLMNQWHSF